MRLAILGMSAVLALLVGAPTAASAGPPQAAEPRGIGVGIAGRIAVGIAGGIVPRTSFAADLERQTVVLVNRVRTENGCPALRTASSLMYASARHSVLMARYRALSHRLPGEPSLLARTAAAGFGGAEMVGENIAVGYRSAPGVVAAWMRSPTHRAIILDCRFREIGVGTVATDGRRWWTMDVGRR